MKGIRSILGGPSGGPWARPSIAALIAVLSLVTVAVPARASSGPIVIEFQKQFDAAATEVNGTPTWMGTTSDGGTVEVRLIDYRATGKAEHITVDFIVATDEVSFVARVAGIFNLSTERTTLNGTIVTGWLEGARVHEEGLRTDANTSHFVGTLQIMPKSRS